MARDDRLKRDRHRLSKRSSRRSRSRSWSPSLSRSPSRSRDRRRSSRNSTHHRKRSRSTERKGRSSRHGERRSSIDDSRSREEKKRKRDDGFSRHDPEKAEEERGIHKVSKQQERPEVEAAVSDSPEKKLVTASAKPKVEAAVPDSPVKKLVTASAKPEVDAAVPDPHNKKSGTASNKTPDPQPAADAGPPLLPLSSTDAPPPPKQPEHEHAGDANGKTTPIECSQANAGDDTTGAKEQLNGGPRTDPVPETTQVDAVGNEKGKDEPMDVSEEPAADNVETQTDALQNDMQSNDDEKSASPKKVTLAAKETVKPKPVGGFFGVDDDDEGFTVAAAKKKKKKKFFSPLDDNPNDTMAMEITAAVAPASDTNNTNDDEEDPLELFMTNIKQQVHDGETTAVDADGMNDSDDEEVGGVKRAASDEEADFVEEEEEEEESWLTKIRKKRLIYEKIDHNKISYGAFKKDFYIESPELTKMTPEEVMQYRRDLGGIRIRGKHCPRPVKTWGQCGLPSKALDMIRKLQYEKPTPIQAQAIPCIMTGRNVIGVAKTGSGKTLAFILPLMRHVAAQPPVAAGEGPIGLIIAPTRELAMQIYGELKKFCKAMNLRGVCAYGGSGVGEQISDLKRGAEVVVCTPGRMIDLLAMNHGRICNLKRATFVVLDEADRMFDMGFEPQITRIVENVRPDRQTVMFSATFPPQVETLARKILKAPLEIVVGGNSVAASTIDQRIEVIEEDQKFLRLLKIIGDWQDKGAILIFVERQEAADRIFRDVSRAGHRCLALHGGMDQADRDSAIVDFKNGDVDILVATSVAARGLDVKRLRVVINYDVPNHYEDYVHRVGRTGRAGNKGTAYTMITKEQDMYASEMVKALQQSARQSLEQANPNVKRENLDFEGAMKAAVPEDLRKLAEEFSKKKSLGLVKHGAGSGYGGKGFKFTESEDNANAEVRKIQAQEYGVEVKTTGNDKDEDKPVIKDIERDGHNEKQSQHAAASNARQHVPVVPPRMATGAGLPDKLSTQQLMTPNGVPYNRMEERMSSRNGEEVRALIERKKQELDELAKKEGLEDEGAKKAMVAREIASVLSALPSSRQMPPAHYHQQQPQLQHQHMQSNMLNATSGGSVEKNAAAAAVAAINLRLKGKSAEAAPEPKEADSPEEVMRKYTELEINDYPQHARWKVTHKNALADVEDATACAVTTKGNFYAPGRNPAAGERKLYLLIEGPDERSVGNAHKEIKRRLDEAAMSRPDDKPQYGKYSVM